MHNSTVDISIEAAFTAVSIAYGVVPKVAPITFGVPPASTARVSIFTTTLGDLVVSLSEKLDEFEFVNTGKIGPRTAAVLKDGLRFNGICRAHFLTRGVESIRINRFRVKLFRLSARRLSAWRLSTRFSTRAPGGNFRASQF